MMGGLTHPTLLAPPPRPSMLPPLAAGDRLGMLTLGGAVEITDGEEISSGRSSPLSLLQLSASDRASGWTSSSSSSVSVKSIMSTASVSTFSCLVGVSELVLES